MRLNWSFRDNSEDFLLSLELWKEVGEVFCMILTIFMIFGPFPSQFYSFLVSLKESVTDRATD